MAPGTVQYRTMLYNTGLLYKPVQECADVRLGVLWCIAVCRTGSCAFGVCAVGFVVHVTRAALRD